MEAMRAALAAAQSGDWSRAYAGAVDDHRPAAAEDVALDGVCPTGCSRPVSRHLRVHRTEPGLAGAEGPAQTCRRGPGRRIGRGRRRLVQTPSAGKPHRQAPRSGDNDELGRSRRRHGRACGRSGSPPISAHSTKRIFWPGTPSSLRPEDHVQRIDRLLWDGQTDAAHRMLTSGAAQLSSAGRGAPGARRASPKSRGARRRGFRRNCARTRGSSSSSCAGGARRR